MIGPGGGIGRHAGLKIQWPSRPYGFKSRPGDTQNKKPCIIRYGAFLIVHFQKMWPGRVAKLLVKYIQWADVLLRART